MNWAELSFEVGRVVLVRDFIGPSGLVRVVFGPSCPAPVVGCSGWVPSVTIMATRHSTSLCKGILCFLRKKGGSSVVAGVATGI